MTVGIIAFFRCTRLTKFYYMEKYGKHFIVGIWIYAVAVFSTLLTYVSLHYACFTLMYIHKNHRPTWNKKKLWSKKYISCPGSSVGRALGF